MAKGKTKNDVDPVEKDELETEETGAAEMTPEQAYHLHNHETAKAGDASKQCQCELCKEHRGE